MFRMVNISNICEVLLVTLPPAACLYAKVTKTKTIKKGDQLKRYSRIKKKAKTHRKLPDDKHELTLCLLHLYRPLRTYRETKVRSV